MFLGHFSDGSHSLLLPHSVFTFLRQHPPGVSYVFHSLTDFYQFSLKFNHIRKNPKPNPIY